MIIRDKNDVLQEIAIVPRDLPAISATGTYAIMLPHPTKQYLIERVELIVDATYASDAANYYVMTLVHGSGPTTSATWSTLTGAQGTLTAATPAAMVLSGVARALNVAPGEILSLVATKFASAANIQPRVVVHGRVL